ncbi:MAG TPA: universal stress protein [Candidatus Limnocylindria bacterium]|nr:universal stress protein [Candidatus Limnocylindria bacterium]
MRILLAYDGSAGAEAARDLLAHLPLPRGTYIAMVAVLERGPALFGVPEIAVVPADAAEAEAQLASDLQDALHSASRALEAPDRRLETKVLRGRTASALLDEARAVQPDLIVIGSRGHGPMSSLLLGSVSAEVVDHAPCPVLVARSPSVHRLVVAVDGSAPAQRALDLLGRWPIFAGMPASVVTVAEPTPTWAMSLGALGGAFYPAWTDLSDEAVANRRRQLGEIGARAVSELGRAGVPADRKVRVGDPANELIRAAAEAGADLIVCGSRGLSTLPRLVLGSVARKVLLHAPTSVLVVREPRERVKSEEPVGVPVGTGVAGAG